MTARIIVIHSRGPIINFNAPADPPAHCFGPYSSYEEALKWDRKTPDDCFKIALDLVGPWPEDLDRVPVHGDHHEGWAGTGPSFRSPQPDA